VLVSSVGSLLGDRLACLDGFGFAFRVGVVDCVAPAPCELPVLPVLPEESEDPYDPLEPDVPAVEPPG
jgi:hypothetical protein